MLLGWEESQRKVHAPPAVKFHEKELPTDLAKAFPKLDLRDYSNSIISFKLTADLHLKDKDLE